MSGGLPLLLALWGAAAGGTGRDEPGAPAVGAALSGPGADTSGSPWTRELVGYLNVSSSYFHDWEQGGEDNLTWSARLMGNLERDGEDWAWSLEGSAEFGQTKSGHRAVRKTSDETSAEAVLRRDLWEWVNPYVSASVQTQFAPGYDYPVDDSSPREEVSGFLDPLQLSQGVGGEADVGKAVALRVGLALREQRARWMAEGENSSAWRARWRVRPGVEWESQLKHTFSGPLRLQSDLTVFADLKSIEGTVVDWDGAFYVQVGRFVNVNLSAQLHRDLEEAKAWQWRQALALGLNYAFL